MSDHRVHLEERIDSTGVSSCNAYFPDISSFVGYFEVFTFKRDCVIGLDRIMGLDRGKLVVRS